MFVDAEGSRRKKSKKRRSGSAMVRGMPDFQHAMNVRLEEAVECEGKRCAQVLHQQLDLHK